MPAAWIDTFVEEKGFDLDEIFEVEGPEWGTNYMTLRTVVAAIKSTSKAEREAIKANLIRLDFMDPAGPKRYMKHLAKGLAL